MYKNIQRYSQTKHVSRKVKRREKTASQTHTGKVDRVETSRIRAL